MNQSTLLAAILAFSAPFAAMNTAHSQPAAAKAPALKAGDPAPQFKVTEWYKGEATTLEADKTYIIECWATWCGPCIRAFPHMSEIAKDYAGKITVIGANVWERKKPEEVKAFVEKQGDNMSYSVVADGEGVIAKDWLKAAGRSGIPCAFVVHKGTVSWIGHPAQLKNDLLDSILDGSYDPAAIAAKQNAVSNYFGQNVAPLLMKKDFEGAIAKMEEMKKEFPSEEKNIDMNIKRFKAMAEKAAQQ